MRSALVAHRLHLARVVQCTSRSSQRLDTSHPRRPRRRRRGRWVLQGQAEPAPVHHLHGTDWGGVLLRDVRHIWGSAPSPPTCVAHTVQITSDMRPLALRVRRHHPRRCEVVAGAPIPQRNHPLHHRSTRPRPTRCDDSIPIDTCTHTPKPLSFSEYQCISYSAECFIDLWLRFGARRLRPSSPCPRHLPHSGADVLPQLHQLNTTIAYLLAKQVRWCSARSHLAGPVSHCLMATPG